MTSQNNNTEVVGPRFSQDGMLEARDKTMSALDEIARHICQGMTEPEGERTARKVLKKLGLLLGWHKVVVRFGCNTVLEYGAPSVPGIVLQKNDIFTLDIGPIWKDWEGDGGNTYVIGDDPEMLRAKQDVKKIWNDVQNHWRNTGAAGAELYDYAAKKSNSLGWVFNPIMAGHRVADFPHQHPGSLSGLTIAPSTHRWILEILIRHKTLPIGAYYEDLLVV
jgi:Xaa-Pro aminopeptidase